MGVTSSVPVKANSGVRARVPAAGKVLEGHDKPTLLREDQHYLHYITMCVYVYVNIVYLIDIHPHAHCELLFSIFGNRLDKMSL